MLLFDVFKIKIFNYAKFLRRNLCLILQKNKPLCHIEEIDMTKKIIIERLVFREAHSFGVSSLSQKEKDGLFQKFQNKFNTAFEFKKFMSDDQWSEEELKEVK